MTSISPVNGFRGPSWLLEVFNEPSATHRIPRWWQWAVLSLGCVSGCASWGQVANNATQPLRATGNLLARTGDQVGDLFEFNSTRHRNPANLPAHQGLVPRSSSEMAMSPKVPMNSGAILAGATLPTVSKPAAMQAVHTAPAATEKPRESMSVPLAPPAVELKPASASVELLPAPPATEQPISNVPPISNVQPVSNSQLAPIALANSTTANAAVSTWCRVRIRNIAQQAAPQVAVTVNSPENAKLVSKDGNTLSAAVVGKMEFAPVTQVGPGEEVILVIGVVATEQRGNRLRVQVRDGLGGSNQDVQARWKVAIEAME